MDNSASLLDLPDASSDDNQEQLRTFVPTPNRVSQFLELKTEEVETQMQSVEGRRKIFDLLVEHEDHLRNIYPTFSTDELSTQLDIVGETLASKQAFTEGMQHEKGIFHRALESTTGFVKNHPVATVILTLAAAAGGVALAAYLAGGMEALLASVGLSHLYGSAGAAEASKVIGEKIIEGAGQLYDGSTAVDML